MTAGMGLLCMSHVLGVQPTVAGCEGPGVGHEAWLRAANLRAARYKHSATGCEDWMLDARPELRVTRPQLRGKSPRLRGAKPSYGERDSGHMVQGLIESPRALDRVVCGLGYWVRDLFLKARDPGWRARGPTMEREAWTAGHELSAPGWESRLRGSRPEQRGARSQLRGARPGLWGMSPRLRGARPSCWVKDWGCGV